MDRLSDYRGYALAIGATLVAGVVTRATWPFLSVAPFVLLFLAVYITTRWGSRRAGIVAVAAAYAWALFLSPPGVGQFSTIPATIFFVIGMLATYLISSRTEALAAREASEARAIRALEETRVAEAKLRQAQKMEAVGQLVAGVAHNFNNLLTITMGYADLLTDHVTDDGRPHLAEIRHATDRGAKLTRQLLAITRKQDAGVTAVDLNTALEELEALLIPLIREDIALSIQLASTPAVVKIDPQDFGQIVLNLVVNARDAIPAAGTITIDLSPVAVTHADIPASFDASPGAFIRLRVTDTGTGMAPEALTHLFEPFFTTKDPDQGTGLGLAFSYGVVQRARGFIAVASAPGEGTTVAMHLPAADVSTQPAPTPPPVSSPAAVTPARILVVEDEAPVRLVATRTLANAGYVVFEASSPLEARAIFEQEKVDVLLTDVVMPGMRGPELARLLQEQQPELRVLLMSGYLAGAAEDAGVYPFLAKPFTRQTLLEAVRSLVATDSAP